MPASRNYASKDWFSRHPEFSGTFVCNTLQSKVLRNATTSTLLQHSECSKRSNKCYHFKHVTSWTIPKIDTKNVYKISWAENTFHSAYKVRTVEQIFSISKTHEKCCLFTKKNISEFLASKKFSYLHIGMVQVAIKPLTR